MNELPLQVLVGALALTPLPLTYWLWKYLGRRRLARAWRAVRPLQPGTIARWEALGVLRPELRDALPGLLSAPQVFLEWAAVDPEAARWWHFREFPREECPLEALVAAAWEAQPEARRPAAEAALRDAVKEAAAWWGGAERGWNRRPLAVPPSLLPRPGRRGAETGRLLLPLDDLTAAPLPGVLAVEPLLTAGSGPELVLALALLRRQAPRYTHPLAPGAGSTASLVSGIGEQVGTDVGRRVGASLGAALGPLGSMVGRYVGELAGRAGARRLAEEVLPEPLATALRETETALAALGALVADEAFARAVKAPEEEVLRVGRTLELIREARARRITERLWPGAGQALLEEVLREALAELHACRTVAAVLLKGARSSPPVVAGGILLQNPWLVRPLPAGPRRLTAARTALNRAAMLLRRAP